MKRFYAMLVLATAALMTGCVSNNYEAYLEANKEIATAQAQAYAQAEIARYNAFAAIAATEDTTAMVASIIALSANGGAQQQRPVVALQQPKSVGEQLLPWASVLVPGLTQGYMVHEQARVNIVQAQANRDVMMSTNETFSAVAGAGFESNAAIAGFIQAPQANVTNNTSIVETNTITTTTTSTDITDSYNPVTTSAGGGGF